MRLADYHVCQDPSQEGPPSPDVVMSDVYGLIASGHITRARSVVDCLYAHYAAQRDGDSVRMAFLALGMRHAIDGVLAYKRRAQRDL